MRDENGRKLMGRQAAKQAPVAKEVKKEKAKANSKKKDEPK